ncbi:MAG: tyrosine-type recombinase/integrase [Microbacterium gubbeenense]
MPVYACTRWRKSTVATSTGSTTASSSPARVARPRVSPCTIASSSRPATIRATTTGSPSPARSGPVGPHAVSSAIRHSMLRVGLDGKPHQLRHSYGTELVRAGVNLRVVQQLMRHESPATTAIYTAVDDEQLRAGIATLRHATTLPLAA